MSKIWYILFYILAVGISVIFWAIVIYIAVQFFESVK